MIERKQKYVPPHLRNRGASPDDHDRRSDSRNGGDRGGYRGGFNERRGGGGGGYDRNESREQRGSTNSRWSSFERGGGERERGGGYESRRGGGDRGGYRSSFRRNELGYHGDMTRNQRLENELFGDAKSSGINFDKVS